MQFVKADAVDFDVRSQITRVFVTGFYEWLCGFVNDRTKLEQLFNHMFILSRFYVAIEGDKVAAMAGYTFDGRPPVQLERYIFVRVLGFIRGHFLFCKVRRHMAREGYPFPMNKNTASIEFVASAVDFRRRGAAAGLLSYMMEDLPHETYILEVADTNKNARALYEKLGFREFKREKAPRKSGVNSFIYMRFVRELPPS